MTNQVQSELIDVAPAEFGRLDPSERERYLWHGERLLRRATWEGSRDLSPTRTMIATVAAHAALLTAGFDVSTDPFRNVAAIVLHPTTIVTRNSRPSSVRGVMTSSPQRLAGQSGHGRGPLLLDWRTVEWQIAAPERGMNVIFHEFAHKLDQLNGAADGMPPLPDAAARAAWEQTIGTNFRRLRRRGSDGLVRAYGATNPAEYFAVTSELFFTLPVELRARLPRVYARLADFYGQDPAERQSNNAH